MDQLNCVFWVNLTGRSHLRGRIFMFMWSILSKPAERRIFKQVCLFKYICVKHLNFTYHVKSSLKIWDCIYWFTYLLNVGLSTRTSGMSPKLVFYFFPLFCFISIFFMICHMKDLFVKCSTLKCTALSFWKLQNRDDSGIMWLIRVHIPHDNYTFREEGLLWGGTDPRWPHLSWCQQMLSSKNSWLSLKGRTPGVWLPGDAEIEIFLQSD